MDEKLEKLTEKMVKCKACHLHKNRENVVPGIYGPKNGLCIIGEAPGYNEDKQGLPFVGRSGSLLDEMLDSVGLSRNAVSILNIVKCRPTDEKGANRTPTISESKFCANKWLFTQLSHLEPKLLVALGGVALRFFFPKAKVTKVAGELKITDNNYLMLITYHPAYLLRNPQSHLLEKYEHHFKKMVKILDGDYIPDKNNNLENQKLQRNLNDFFS